jgi:hypothetical protein
MGFDEFFIFYNAYKNDNSQANIISQIDQKISDRVMDMLRYVTYQQYTVQLNPEWDALCDEVRRLSENVHLRIGDFVITVWSEGSIYVELLQDIERRNDRMNMGEDDDFYREVGQVMPVSWDTRILVSSCCEVFPRGQAGIRYDELVRNGQTDEAVRMMIDICRRETNDWRRANGG